MIKLEKTDVLGWEAAIRGLRNPMNSWSNSDSYWTHIEDVETLETAKYQFFLGDNDLRLMQGLSKAGDDHGKFLRMINVTFDITAPLYWWKEFDTYKVGTVANSCSTMHKIHAKEFALGDFSWERLNDSSIEVLELVIDKLNENRKLYIETKDKHFWEQMIQLLPSSYEQKRTIQANYQVLKSMYAARVDHKLTEWRDFCKWCETLPYFSEICLEK